MLVCEDIIFYRAMQTYGLQNPVIALRYITGYA
jgi:hypothetical protein